MSEALTEAFNAAEASVGEGIDGEAPVEAPAPEATAPTETPETPRQYQVKVRGQESFVDEAELINGYQRQADYTKSTQELAIERQRLEAAEQLWNSLHEDPSTVLAAIQEHFAEQLGGEPPDPRDARVAEVEAYVEQQKQAALEAQVASTLSNLQDEFGEFDGDALLEYAIDNRIPDLQAAFLHRQYAQGAADREATRMKAKQEAPPVEGGSRAQGAHEVPPKAIGNLEDALEAALAEHGVTSLTNF